jgi:DNA-binding response OmpR family regulator
MNKPFALIIEDDPKLNIILDTALHQLGFDTGIDARGDQYQSILSTTTPALIILDIHLPYASGKDIHKALKSDPSLKNTLILITTADVYLARKLENETENVLVKPVSVGRLKKIIEERCPEYPKPGGSP